MIASSSSSPPIRIDWETTMPPSEITATSLVPPPMSTTMLPVGSPTGRPAPIAAAIGSSIRYAWRAAQHALGLDPHRVHLARARVDRHHARLRKHDPAPAHVDERVGRAEVD